MIENSTRKIIQFLENDINQALLIKGKSGVGKSHYIKNKLFPIVRDTLASAKTSDDKFYPVFISLYGLRSVEEIKEHLFLEFAPLLKNKNVGVSSAVKAFITKVFSKVAIEQFLHQEQLLSELPIFHKSVSFVSQIRRFLIELFSKNKTSSAAKVKMLICFDDFNRTSNTLQSKELFGFVRTMLECTDIKVLLVETEDELASGTANYLLMRETIIGGAMTFKTNDALAYEEIITTTYKEQFPSYFDFLRKRSQDIVSKSEAYNSNLRTLIFFLERYELLFTTIQEILKKDIKPALSAAEYFNRTFNYALSIALEFKMGGLTPRVIFSLQHENDERNFGKHPLFEKDPFSDELTLQELEIYEEIVSYKQHYEEKYLQNIQFQPIAIFDSIFDYIVGNTSFICEKKLTQELKPFKVVNNYPIFNPLFEVEVLNLPPSEIDKFIDKMLILVDNAVFHLSEYTHVFKIVNRFFNTKTRIKPLLKNEEDTNENSYKEAYKELIERFKKGIDAWKLQYNSIDYPEFNVDLGAINDIKLDELYLRNPFVKEEAHLHKLEFNECSSESVHEINMYSQKVYHDIRAQYETHQVTLLCELYIKDMIAFIEKLNDPNLHLSSYPIYAKFDFKEFWSVFKKATNSQLVTFGLHLEERYRVKQGDSEDHLTGILSSEKPFFCSLREKLSEERAKFQNPLFSDFDEIVVQYLLKEVNSLLSM
ncbi:MAG: hypothetical protein AB8B65_18325 [Kordia sp.]|uniref:hypothetical protein n=1 Tax=Kordia sp. TaxID=1965332 RepID=UPI00385F0102